MSNSHELMCILTEFGNSRIMDIKNTGTTDRGTGHPESNKNIIKPIKLVGISYCLYH